MLTVFVTCEGDELPLATDTLVPHQLHPSGRVLGGLASTRCHRPLDKGNVRSVFSTNRMSNSNNNHIYVIARISNNRRAAHVVVNVHRTPRHHLVHIFSRTTQAGFVAQRATWQFVVRLLQPCTFSRSITRRVRRTQANVRQSYVNIHSYEYNACIVHKDVHRHRQRSPRR